MNRIEIGIRKHHPYNYQGSLPNPKLLSAKLFRCPDACMDIVTKFDVLVLDVLREKAAREKERKSRQEST